MRKKGPKEWSPREATVTLTADQAAVALRAAVVYRSPRLDGTLLDRRTRTKEREKRLDEVIDILTDAYIKTRPRSMLEALGRAMDRASGR